MAENNFKKGDLVIYGGTLFRCKEDSVDGMDLLHYTEETDSNSGMLIVDSMIGGDVYKPVLSSPLKKEVLDGHDVLGELKKQMGD